MSIALILLIVAAVCFLLAAVGVPASRINLTALGLFFWVLSLILGPSVDKRQRTTSLYSESPFTLTEMNSRNLDFTQFASLREW